MLSLSGGVNSFFLGGSSRFRKTIGVNFSDVARGMLEVSQWELSGSSGWMLVLSGGVKSLFPGDSSRFRKTKGANFEE